MDFNGRCAYCDDRDFYCGGSKTFHVEHFAPKEKFPAFRFVYENLLYSCSFCNVAKSDTWPSNDPAVSVVGDEGFVNPCSEDYDKHLARLPNGKIDARTNLGKYMIRELKLYLYRHELFYKLEQVEEKRKLLESAINEELTLGMDPSAKQEFLYSINNDFFRYYSDWQSLDS